MKMFKLETTEFERVEHRMALVGVISLSGESLMSPPSSQAHHGAGESCGARMTVALQSKASSNSGNDNFPNPCSA